MNRRRVSVAAMVASLGLVGPLVPTQIAAAAAGTPPVVHDWGSVVDHPEFLYVDATSDSAIASVTATVTDGTAQREVTFEQQDAGSWRSQPIVLAGLGDHAAAIRVVDADGDVANVSGGMAYNVVPVLGTHSMDDEVTFDDQRLTVQGHVDYYDPRTRTTGLLPDGLPLPSVSLSPFASNGYLTAVLGRDGNYRLDAPVLADFGVTAKESVRLDFVAAGPMNGLAGRSNSVVEEGSVTKTAARTKVTINPATVAGKYQAQASVHGAVWRKVGDAWAGVPGARVQVVGKSVLTGADGRFVATFTLTRSAKVRGWAVNPFLKNGLGRDPYAELTVLVQQPSILTLTHPHLYADSWFTFDTQIVPAKPVLSRAGRVYLETWTGSTWRRLGYVTTGASGGAASWAGYIAHPSWKYRVHFLGSQEMAASVSPSITLPRKDARMINNKVSPTTVRVGGSITISGKAQKLSGGRFVSVGDHREIQVFFFTKGGTKWVYKGSAYTTASGAFSKKFTQRKDGWWGAVWFTTSSKWVNAYGPDLFVDVTASSTSTSAASAAPPSLTGVTSTGSRPAARR